MRRELSKAYTFGLGAGMTVVIGGLAIIDGMEIMLWGRGLGDALPSFIIGFLWLTAGALITEAFRRFVWREVE